MTLVDILINWHCMLKCQKQSYFKRIKISNQRQQKQKFCCSFTYLANAFYDKSSFYKIIGDMFRRQWFKKTEFVVKSCNLYTKLDCRNDWKKKQANAISVQYGILIVETTMYRCISELNKDGIIKQTLSCNNYCRDTIIILKFN